MKISRLCQLQMTLPGDFRGVSGVTVRLMSDRELQRLLAGALFCNKFALIYPLDTVLSQMLDITS
jgi:hypothetical protein